MRNRRRNPEPPEGVWLLILITIGLAVFGLLILETLLS